jgi:thiamine-phosphate pyrophosphorylase
MARTRRRRCGPTAGARQRREAAIDASLRRARAQRLRGLYALTSAEPDTAALVGAVTAALEGGAAAIQYRGKDRSRCHEQARALARLLAARGGIYVVNDDATLARDVGADGVHLGEDDGSIAEARALLGPERLVGVSCYDDLERARHAVAQGADYVAFGSFYPSSTKPAARRAGPELLAAARNLGVPVVAIGGITAQNAPALIDAGADAVAVIADVFAREDAAAIRAAAESIARLFRTRSASPDR